MSSENPTTMHFRYNIAHESNMHAQQVKGRVEAILSPRKCATVLGLSDKMRTSDIKTRAETYNHLSIFESDVLFSYLLNLIPLTNRTEQNVRQHIMRLINCKEIHLNPQPNDDVAPIPIYRFSDAGYPITDDLSHAIGLVLFGDYLIMGDRGGYASTYLSLLAYGHRQKNFYGSVIFELKPEFKTPAGRAQVLQALKSLNIKQDLIQNILQLKRYFITSQPNAAIHRNPAKQQSAENCGFTNKKELLADSYLLFEYYLATGGSIPLREWLSTPAGQASELAALSFKKKITTGIRDIIVDNMMLYLQYQPNKVCPPSVQDRAGYLEVLCTYLNKNFLKQQTGTLKAETVSRMQQIRSFILNATQLSSAERAQCLLLAGPTLEASSTLVKPKP